MNYRPQRLLPGCDLRQTLEQAARTPAAEPVFVVAGIGSLDEARLRFAGAGVECAIGGPLEILSLSGTVTTDGAHLHMTVADERGRVYGGHVCYGNLIATTAELLFAPLAGWELSREMDENTRYRELLVRPSGEA